MRDEHDPKKHRKLLGWKAWYNDGSVYRSDEHKWEEIPQDGIEVLKRYWFDEKTDPQIYGEVWTGQDIYVLDDQFRDKIKRIPKAIKIGRWMSKDDFFHLYDTAKAETEIINKII